MIKCKPIASLRLLLVGSLFTYLSSELILCLQIAVNGGKVAKVVVLLMFIILYLCASWDVSSGLQQYQVCTSIDDTHEDGGLIESQE